MRDNFYKYLIIVFLCFTSQNSWGEEVFIKALEVELNKNNKTVPKDLNQLVRWVNTKEEHAQHIQDVIMQYFLAQRVKPKNVSDEGYTDYVSLTLSCQKIIFHAMKCKQNTEVSYSEILLKEVNLLIDSYFDDHGKQHLNELMSK